MSFKKKYIGLAPLIVVSLLYLICIFIVCLGDLLEVKEMKPNEWGDFLAGTFAPLALMWLVFGYRQQGEELKQNTEALKLQALELKNSVEQQKELVKATNEEIEFIKERENRQIKLETIQAQPYFHIDDLLLFVLKHENEILIQIHFKFRNSRSLCRSLFFLYNVDDTDVSKVAPENHFDIVDRDLEKNHTVNLYTSIPINNLEYLPKKIYLTFNYTDLYDDFHTQGIVITLGNDILNNHKDYIYQWNKKSFNN